MDKRQEATRPEPGRKAPETPGRKDSPDKGHTSPGKTGEKAPGVPMEKPSYTHGMDDDRSDRESGRPVQLPGPPGSGQPGRADVEPGLGGQKKQTAGQPRRPEEQPAKH